MFERVRFVVHAKLIDDGGAGFVQANQFDRGALATEFDDHLVECTDRGDVPEVRLADVDTDLLDGLLEIESRIAVVG